MIIKEILREVIAFFSYYLYYKFVYKRFEIGRNGQKLLKGITAVVAAKNEAYTLPLCLKSLINIADQIICIDNGSNDGTLQKMYDFKKEYEHKVEVEIVSMPNALLGECRDKGLELTKYQWHLRWDADMVAKTSGTESMILLKEKVIKKNTPQAIQLPRINLYGDLHHTSRMGDVIDPGEPILIKFCKHICYKEYGKFDTVKLPVYYRIIKEKKKYYFHCTGLKSTQNLIHRFHYFAWREKLNKAKLNGVKLDDTLTDFEKFKKQRELNLFQTNDIKSLKYRYARQLSELHFIRFEKKKYGDYPDILKEKMHNANERFKVVYENGAPYYRIDLDDTDMLNYLPTIDDQQWSPQEFLKKLLKEK